MPDLEIPVTLWPRMSGHNPYEHEEQEEQVAVAEAEAALGATLEDRDLHWLMRGKKGRRFMRRLLERSGPIGSSFVTNAMQMSFNEGQKDIGVWMLIELQRVCPDLYVTMLLEKKEDA